MSDALAIIVPTLNAAATVDGALVSVERALAACGLAEVELLVIDGGSTDSTRERVALNPMARWIMQRSSGLAGARNEAIAATTAPLLAFCDADDAWTVDSLRLRFARLKETPSAWAVSGRVRFVDRQGAQGGGPVRRRAETEHPGVTPGAMLVRRSAVECVGPFDPALRIGADADWIVRALQLLGPLESVDEVVLEKGLRVGSLSTEVAAYRREMLTVARRFVNRSSLKREP